MANALPNPSGDVFRLTEDILSKGLSASRQSNRLRIIQPVQRSQEATVQRLLNFLQPGTYIRPHCHPLPHATESICLISGALEVLIFDSRGTITSRHQLSPSAPLIDLEPGVWHGMIVKEPDTIIFEVKQGPYEPMDDKDFAPWAPQKALRKFQPSFNDFSKADAFSGWPTRHTGRERAPLRAHHLPIQHH